jgi:hypothetical protein
MSNLERFAEYAEAFEQTLRDDDWSRLGPYFAEGAVYVPGDVDEAVGRDNVVRALRDSVNSLDRKFDSREIAEDLDLSEDGATVTMSFVVTYRKSGLPDLTISGIETATYADGEIQRLEDVIDEAVVAAMASWMAQHADALG